MKIRIVSKGWDSFNGVMAGVQFENGVSVTDVDRRVRDRIAAAVRVEDADEDGAQVGPGQDVIDGATVKAPVQIQLERLNMAEEAAKERDLKAAKQAEVEARAAAAALEAAKEKGDEGGYQVFTRTELEAIGNESGIGELRKIAAPLDVKGRAIDEIVNGIIEAQDKRIARSAS